MLMKCKLNVIEFNVSAFRQNEKLQTSYSLSIEENLTTDDLLVKIDGLCKSLKKRNNIVCVWFEPPFNIRFLSGDLIDEATVVINYTQMREVCHK